MIQFLTFIWTPRHAETEALPWKYQHLQCDRGDGQSRAQFLAQGSRLRSWRGAEARVLPATVFPTTAPAISFRTEEFGATFLLFQQVLEFSSFSDVEPPLSILNHVNLVADLQSEKENLRELFRGSQKWFRNML